MNILTINLRSITLRYFFNKAALKKKSIIKESIQKDWVFKDSVKHSITLESSTPIVEHDQESSVTYHTDHSVSSPLLNVVISPSSVKFRK